MEEFNYTTEEILTLDKPVHGFDSYFKSYRPKGCRLHSVFGGISVYDWFNNAIGDRCINFPTAREAKKQFKDLYWSIYEECNSTNWPGFLQDQLSYKIYESENNDILGVFCIDDGNYFIATFGSEDDYDTFTVDNINPVCEVSFRNYEGYSDYIMYAAPFDYDFVFISFYDGYDTYQSTAVTYIDTDSKQAAAASVLDQLGLKRKEVKNLRVSEGY